ncbi:hypothetical protein MASR1M97_28800 [Candidatus Desulfobacillus denitrificans]
MPNGTGTTASAGLAKKRRIAIRVEAHLPRMGRVVAADAIDAAHGKPVGSAGDRNGGLRGRFEDIGHAALLGPVWPIRSALSSMILV